MLAARSASPPYWLQYAAPAGQCLDRRQALGRHHIRRGIRPRCRCLKSDVDLDAAIVGVRIDSALRVRSGDDIQVLAVSRALATSWRSISRQCVTAHLQGTRSASGARLRPLVGTDAGDHRAGARPRAGRGGLPQRRAAAVRRDRLRDPMPRRCRARDGSGRRAPVRRWDRPRRVNSKVSQRRGELHGLEAFTEQATEIVVLLDSVRTLAVHRAAQPSPASSLDIAVRAAVGWPSTTCLRTALRMLDIGERVRALRRASAAGAPWPPYSIGCWTHRWSPLGLRLGPEVKSAGWYRRRASSSC